MHVHRVSCVTVKNVYYNFILGGVGNCEFVNVFLFYSLGAKIVSIFLFHIVRVALGQAAQEIA